MFNMLVLNELQCYEEIWILCGSKPNTSFLAQVHINMWTSEKLRVQYIITAFYTIVDDCRNQLQMNQCYQGSWIGWQISYSAQRNKIGFCFDDVTISMGSKRWSTSMSNLISNPYLCFWSKTRSEQGFASTTKCVSERMTCLLEIVENWLRDAFKIA